MSNVYENLNSSNFNSHIDSGDLNGGSKITKVMDIGKNARKITGEVILTGGTILATAGLLGGCAPSESIVSTPEPTSITTIDTSEEIVIKTSDASTETVKATPSPTKTVETPTPTLNPEEQKEARIQRYQDFLNKEGEFTKEKMNYLPIYPKESNAGDEIDLGMLRVYGDYITAYGYFFDYIKTDNNDILLIMGFDGKDGERFITPIKIASSVNDYYLDNGNKDLSAFWFIKEGGLHIDDNIEVAFKAYGSLELADYLEGLKGKKLGLEIPAVSIDVKSLEGKVDSVLLGYLGENNKSLPFVRAFVDKLATNGVDTSTIGSSNKEIITIDNIDDLDLINFENSIFVDVIRYKQNG